MIPSHLTVDDLNAKYNINMTKHLGIKYTEIGENYLCGEMPVDERTKQPMGVLHGGASVVLAESLGSMAANCCVDQKTEFCVGQEINANHVKSVQSGIVKGIAKAVHIGRKTHVWEIRITNEAGKLVCISRLTIAVVKKEK